MFSTSTFAPLILRTGRPALRQTRLPCRYITSRHQPSRNFQTTSHNENDIAEATSASVTEAPFENTPSSTPEQHAEQISQALQAQSSIPWYLQHQSSTRAPVAPQVELPDLPQNPPPLLHPILEYLSITAGLDDLEILDLRNLDPPPALGSKLIMIIATARSEKHLHVSADRFCRYLRQEHKLKANAAGLLGRNELKIKLRRKAKRMRLLANVGVATPEGNIDDGIRTNWICCTLSKIAPHEQDKSMQSEDDASFVGFRDVKPGVNVVVQMFTEQKREETDLETLWNGVLRTHARKKDAADEEVRSQEEDVDGEEETVQSSTGVAQAPTQPEPKSTSQTVPFTPFRRPKPTAGDVFPSSSSFDKARQLRRIHQLGLR